MKKVKKEESKTPKSIVTKKINAGKFGFDLDAVKKSKNLLKTAVFKKEDWYELAPAFKEATGIPGPAKGHITIFRGHTDTGKAQPLSSKILTPNGWILMKDIQPSMEIMGKDGNTQEVLAIYPQGVRPVYKVTTSDGAITYCDEEHLWSINEYKNRHKGKKDKDGIKRYAPDYSFSTMKTSDMMKKVKYKVGGTYPYANNFQIPVNEPMEFVSFSNLPIDPYVLGCFLGDGSISDMVCITTKDDEIVESIQNTNHHRKTFRRERNDNYLDHVFLDNDTKHIIIGLGLQKDCYGKFIPKEFIYQATIENRLQLLQGLMDTDGTCDKYGSPEFSTSSERLKDDIVELINSLGGVSNVRSKIPSYKYKGEKRFGQRSYTVSVKLPYDFSPFKLSRKVERLNNNRNDIKRYISDISYSHEEECQCILVSNSDHLYVTDDYIITHNTTAMVETAIAVQKSGDLPVFIITEMKWSWERAKTMGFEVTEVVDTETGEISYTGDFLYIDRGSLNTVEDVAAFIADMIDEQSNGIIPVNMCFLWDSAGSIPSLQSYESNKNNAMWNAGAMATQFGNFINQKIVLSRKDTSKYTNTLVVVNKIRVEYPMGGNPKEQPKMKNKGGDAMFWDATYVFTFGNIKGPGTTKVKAVKDGKQVEWAKIVRVSVDKNHMTGVTTSGMIVTTAHGFIQNDKKDMDKYKKAHVEEWAKILGSTDFEIVEEEDNTEVKMSSED